jgi:hypothetical protein
VDVGHGLAALGRAIENFRAAVADFVVEENGVVFGDFHESLQFQYSVVAEFSNKAASPARVLLKTVN